jgi:hypothetical protein
MFLFFRLAGCGGALFRESLGLKLKIDDFQ